MSDDNSNPGIKIDLEVEKRGLLDSIKNAMAEGVKLVQNMAGQIKSALDSAFSGNQQGAGAQQFNDLSAALKGLVAEFSALRDSQLSWQEASTRGGASLTEQITAFGVINEIVGRTGMSYRDAAAQALASGQVTIGAAQQVINANKEQLLSITEVATSLKTLQGNAQGTVAPITETAEATKKASSGFDVLTQRIKAFLVARIIFGAFRELTKLIEDATKAAIEFAQAQYALTVQVGAANSGVGPFIGTLAKWQMTISQLRGELQDFSQTDITQAVVQVVKLTRAYELDEKQQRQLITTAAALAKTSGQTLAEAADKLLLSLEGSTRGLRQYGIAISQGDVAAKAFQLGFTEKLETTTTALTDQQRAMSILALVTEKTNPLFDQLAQNEDTLPRQIDRVNSRIADQTVKLGNSFTDLALLFKNIYSDILGFLQQVIDDPIIQKALDTIKTIDALYNTRNKIANVFDPAKKMADLGLTAKPGDRPNEGILSVMGRAWRRGFGAQDAQTPAGNLGGVPFYKPEQLQGSKAALDAYIQYLADSYKKAQDLVNPPTKQSQQPGHGGTPKGPLAGFALDDKLVKDIIDSYDKFQQDMKDLDAKNLDEMAKAGDDRAQAIQKAGEKLAKAYEDLETEIKRKKEDASLNRDRDLVALDVDTAEKREKIEQDFRDKSVDEEKKYQDKLKELNDQFYFDLQDAVTANDAVAIRKLERKYNLDKKKLDDSLKEKKETEEKDKNKKLQEIDDETTDRRAKIQERYVQDLEDIAKFSKRKREDLKLGNDRELADIFAHYQATRDKISEEYTLQQQIIIQHFNERHDKIGQALKDEGIMLSTAFIEALKKYKAFYGPDGSFIKILEGYYKRAAELQGNLANGINILPGTITPGQLPAGATGLTGTINGQPVTVLLTSDGTITETQLEQIRHDLANIIANLVIVNGGGSGPPPTTH